MPSHEGSLSEADPDAERHLEELDEEFARTEEEEGLDTESRREWARSISSDVSRLSLSSYSDSVIEMVDLGGVPQNAGEVIAERQEVINDLQTALADLSRKFAEAETSRKQYNLSRFLAVFSILSTASATASLIYTAIRNAAQDKPAPAVLPPDAAKKVSELVRAWNDEPDDDYWVSLAVYVETSEREKRPFTLADQILFMDYTIGMFPAQTGFVWDSGEDVQAHVDELVTAYTNGGSATPAMYRHVQDMTYHGIRLPRAVAAGLLRFALVRILVESAPVSAVFAEGEGDLTPEPHSAEDQRADSEEEAEAARERDGFAAANTATAQAITTVVDRLSVSTTNCQAVDAARDSAPIVVTAAISDPTPDLRASEQQSALERAMNSPAKATEATKDNNTRRYLAIAAGLVSAGTAAAVILEYLIRASRKQPTNDLPPVPDATAQTIEAMADSWREQTDAAYWTNFAEYLDKNPGALTAADQLLFCNYTIQLFTDTDFFLWDSAGDKAKVADDLVAAYEAAGQTISAAYRTVVTATYQGKPLPRAVAADVLRLAIAWIYRVPLTAGTPQGKSLADPHGVPVQHRPIVQVERVTAGTSRTVYGRQLLRDLHAGASPRLSAAIDHWTPGAGVRRHLADASAVMAALPPVAAACLHDQYARLKAKLLATFPTPDGEVLRQSSLTVLARPVDGLPKGTLVWIRETDTATVHFVFPAIVVDTATGRPRLHGLPRNITLPPARTPQLVAGPARVGGAADTALQVAGNLVWALPEPWGPVGAAAMTLVQALFGSSGPSPFAAVVTQMENFIQQQEIAAEARTIQGFANWMVTQQSVLASTQADNTQYIQQQLLPELRQMTSPGGGSVYDALQALHEQLSIDGVFDLFMVGGSVQLLGLKMIVQLDALLASTAQKHGDDAAFEQFTDLWLADYANFLASTVGAAGVSGLVQQAAGHIADVQGARLAQITEPYRYTESAWVPAGSGGAYAYTYGWTYRDLALKDNDLTNFIADTFTGGNCCSDGTRVEHQDTVQEHRDAHVTDVVGQLDKTFQSDTDTIKAWQGAIAQWNAHLPPRPPTSAPMISGWTASTPQGVNWQDGNRVSYAIAFANAQGPSQLGPWSDPQELNGKAFPTLAGLPDDPLQMAQTRQIHRRIDPVSGPAVITIVGVVTDMSVHTYTDNRL